MIRIPRELAITLVLCGAALALAPPASDYMASRQVAQVLVERTDFQHVSMGVGPMSVMYRLGLWSPAAGMIAVAVAGSVTLPSAQHDSAGLRNEGASPAI